MESALPTPGAVAAQIGLRTEAAKAERTLVRSERELLAARERALDAFIAACTKEEKRLSHLLLPMRARKRRHGEFREAAIAVLEEAGGDGISLELFERRVLERYKDQVHYKTPSMTLNRLRNEGVVTKESNVWRLTKLR